MKPSNEKATPRPWRLGDRGLTVFGAPNGKPSPKTVVRQASNQEEKANAELIVRAVNNFDSLLEACHELLHGLEGECNLSETAKARNCRRLSIARQAIAKATEGR